MKRPGLCAATRSSGQPSETPVSSVSVVSPVSGRGGMHAAAKTSARVHAALAMVTSAVRLASPRAFGGEVMTDPELHFGDRLAAEVGRTGVPGCVGLD